MSLVEVFGSLPRPSEQGCYSIQPDEQGCRVARSHENHPVVVMRFATEDGASKPRRLANIAYTPPASVEIVSALGGRRTERLAILECRTTDAPLIGYFFHVVSTVLLADSGDETHFENSLDALVTLFRALQRPGTRSVQGLWTELAIIAWSESPTVALSAWHSSAHTLHDFATGAFRLEVKGTVKAVREHVFSLNQLSAMPTGATLIASVMLREAEDGASVFDLIDAIERTIAGAVESVRRLEAIVADSLGAAWRDAADLRFDLAGARESLSLFAADRIPRVPEPLPVGVKEVRFVADLSNTPPLGLDDARIADGPLRQLLPPNPRPHMFSGKERDK